MTKKKDLIKTIFDVKEYTMLILLVFAGLKNPVEIQTKSGKNRKYPVSWYMIVRPNLVAFSLNGIKRPYIKSSKSLDNKADFNFIQLEAKLDRGLHQYKLNNHALIKYLLYIIDGSLPKQPELSDDRNRHFPKAIKAFIKNYKPTKDNDEYWDNVRHRLFSNINNKYRGYLLQMQLEELKKIYEEKNFEYLEPIVPVFQQYCRRLVLIKNIDVTFNEIIKSFIIGVAIFPKDVFVDRDYHLTEEEEKRYLIISKFMQICEIYDMQLNKSQIELTQLQKEAVLCLMDESKNIKSPFRLTPIF